MTRRIVALAALATVIAGFASAPAAAASIERVAWSMPASACTIVDGAELADQTIGRVRYGGTPSGQIRLACPISDLRSVGGALLKPNAIFVTFLDTSGSETKGTKTFVSARLFRMSLANASLGLMAFVSSESTASTSGRVSAPFLSSLPVAERAFDFDRNTYLVEVTLQRQTPDFSLSVFAVGLTTQVAPIP